jgi:hypothetical protein
MSESKSNNELKLNKTYSLRHLHPTAYDRILHDIRNMVILSESQINAVRELAPNKQMEIILTYNTVMCNVTDLLNNM